MSDFEKMVCVDVSHVVIFVSLAEMWHFEAQNSRGVCVSPVAAIFCC